MKNREKFSNATKSHPDLFDRVIPTRQFGFRRSESYLVTTLDEFQLGHPEALNRTRKRKILFQNSDAYIFWRVCPISELPLCRLRKILAKLEEIAIQDATEWKGHILVCTTSFDVFEFVATLRSGSVTAEEYKRLLFLAPQEPNAEDFAYLLQFPGVYYIVGDARKKADLLRAGLEGADKVVLMNMTNSSQVKEETNEYIDSNTVVVSHLIYSMYTGTHQKKFVINDLRKLASFDRFNVCNCTHLALADDKENVKFLRPTPMKYRTKGANDEDIIVTSREKSTEDSYTYTPVFSSGRVIASSMMGSILYQTYYNPMIVKIFRYFCGIRREVHLKFYAAIVLRGWHERMKSIWIEISWEAARLCATSQFPSHSLVFLSAQFLKRWLLYTDSYQSDCTVTKCPMICATVSPLSTRIRYLLSYWDRQTSFMFSHLNHNCPLNGRRFQCYI